MSWIEVDLKYFMIKIYFRLSTSVYYISCFQKHKTLGIQGQEDYSGWCTSPQIILGIKTLFWNLLYIQVFIKILSPFLRSNIVATTLWNTLIFLLFYLFLKMLRRLSIHDPVYFTHFWEIYNFYGNPRTIDLSKISCPNWIYKRIFITKSWTLIPTHYSR